MHSVSKHVRFSELTVKIWMKVDLYCQRQRCSLVTLVSVNMRFVPIFEGFIGDRASNDSGVIESMDFHGFRRYVFSSLRNETNVIVYYYLISCRLSTDPEIWPWLTLNTLNVHYTQRYSIGCGQWLRPKMLSDFFSVSHSLCFCQLPHLA